MNPASRRVEWLDAARGIGIILVVMGHAERGLVTSGILKGDVWAVFDLSIYTFHMPLFMLLAGINVKSSLAKGTGPFLKARARTIAYPYALWSLIQGAMLVAMAGVINGKGDWSKLLRIGWEPISPFWFLYALMAFVLLVAAVGLRPRVLVPVAIAALAASGLISGENILHQMAYMFPFFIIGALGSAAIKQWHVRWIWLPALVAAWLAAYQIVPTDIRVPYLTPWSFPAALAGCAFVMALAQTVRGPLKEMLAALGRISMTIYVMHVLATAGTRIVMVKLGIEAPGAVYLAACTAAGIAAPLIAHVVLDRLGLLPWLGLTGKLGQTARPARSAGPQPESSAPVHG